MLSRELALDEARKQKEALAKIGGWRRFLFLLTASLAALAEEVFPGLSVTVHGIPNRLFGGAVNVAGLLCGKDIAWGLAGKELGEELLLPAVMLRHEKDKFLDDTTVPWLEGQTGTPIRLVENDGARLLDAMLGREAML